MALHVLRQQGAALPYLVIQGGEVLTQPLAGLGDPFFYFLKIGSVLFGSGYILIAYIIQQLLDAVAVGQAALRTRINSTWLTAGGGLVGLIVGLTSA